MSDATHPGVFIKIAILIFSGCWIYFVLFTLYFYFELYKIWKFERKVFGRGRIVFSAQELWNKSGTSPQIGQPYETPHGKYIFTAPDLCLFREKLFIPKIRVNSGLKLKGAARFENGQVQVIGRLPYGMATAGWAWILAWLIVPAVFISKNIHLGFSSLAVLIGLLFPVLFRSYVNLEKKRLRRVLDELRAALLQ